MRRVTLQLRVRSEPRQRIWLRLGQVVEAGSSDAADIYIPDDPVVQPIHVSIAHQPMGCFCECLVDQAEMRINSHTGRRKRLKHGDVVSFGDCDLEISIEEEAAKAALLDVPTTPLAESPEFATESNSPILGGTPIDLSPEFQSSPSDSNDGFPSTPVVASDPSPAPPIIAGDSPIVLSTEFAATGSDYATEKLVANIWRYHAAPENGLDLETLVGRLAELFDTFLLVSPSTAERMATERKLPARVAEINVGMSLVENPPLTATLALLRGESSRHEVLLIASRSGLHELAASLQEHAFTFGRPSIFAMQVSVAHQSMLDQCMFGKVAVLTTESGGWDLYSTIDPREEYQFLGFDRPPAARY